MIKIFQIFLALLITVVSQGATIKGILVDEKNEPFSDVMVKIKDQAIGTKSKTDGSFEINVPDGEYVLQISIIGYNKIEQKVNVSANLELGVITLKPLEKQISEVVIVSKKNESSNNALLQEQKKSTVIEDKIGAQAMSEKGASNAAAAVGKVAGVSNSGDDIFVRGLGDRYNSTMLNNLSLPSENPELKNVSLSFFPSGIIKNIGVAKTFNYRLNGDFGGAGINIETKDDFEKNFISVGISFGQNFLVNNNSVYGSGMNYLGKIDNVNLPTRNLNVFEYGNINWSPNLRNEPYLNSDLNLIGGWKSTSKNGLTYGVFATIGSGSSFMYRNGVNNEVSANGNYNQKYIRTQSGLEVNQNALVNFFVRNKRNEFKLNFVNLVNSKDYVNTYYGWNNSINEFIYKFRNLKENNNIKVIQLMGSSKVNNIGLFKWGLAWNSVNSIQPNRTTNELKHYDTANIYILSTNAISSQSDYFQFLNENQWNTYCGYEFTPGNNPESKNKMYIGLVGNIKSRTFDAYEYFFKATATNNYPLSPSTINQFFNQYSFEAQNFIVDASRTIKGEILPNSYTGNMFNGGLVVDYNIFINSKFNIDYGFKAEYINQKIGWDVAPTYASITQGSSQFNKVKLLPYANLKYLLNDKTNLKAALSRTYTLPQFKEIAPFTYYDINSASFGNPYLYASNVYNLDLKYELFPKLGEVVSYGLFGKYIQNPISKSQVSSSSNEVSFVNSGNYGYVLGIECEIRKKIFSAKGTSDNGLNLGLNLAYLYSQQELSTQKILDETNNYINSVFTNSKSALQGASPILANFDLSYKNKYKKYNFVYTLVMNYKSGSLYSLGVMGANHQYELGMTSLDLVTKHKFNNNIQITLNFRNILNARYQRYQMINDTKFILSEYYNGRSVSMGISLNL